MSQCSGPLDPQIGRSGRLVDSQIGRLVDQGTGPQLGGLWQIRVPAAQIGFLRAFLQFWMRISLFSSLMRMCYALLAQEFKCASRNSQDCLSPNLLHAVPPEEFDASHPQSPDRPTAPRISPGTKKNQCTRKKWREMCAAYIFIVEKTCSYETSFMCFFGGDMVHHVRKCAREN